MAVVRRGPEERNALVVRWSRLPRYVYARLRKCGQLHNVSMMPQDEAVAVGLLTLVRAADRWDPDRGPFPKYAFVAVARDLIRRSARESVVHVPERAARSSAPCRLAARRAYACLRLEDALSEQGEPAAPPDPAPEWERREMPAAVLEALAALSPARREVLRLRFWGGATLAAAAASLGVSSERARQLELSALRQLRQRLAGGGASAGPGR